MKYNYEFTFWRLDLATICDCFLTLTVGDGEAAKKIYRIYKVDSDGWSNRFAPFKITTDKGVEVDNDFQLYSILKIPK